MKLGHFWINLKKENKMNFPDLFSTDEFVHALGWTILHSIWQIAIIAFLLGFALLFMKRSSSSVRYYASVFAMILVIIISIVTFANEYSNNPVEKLVNQEFQLSQIEQEYAEAVISDTNSHWESTFVGRFRTYFDENLPLIVVIWNLIVLVLLLKTIGGLAYSQRLKSYKTSLLSELWESKLTELSNKLGIKRSIQILESSILKVPVVIGYFKPVILIPLGVASGLSYEQVEAILAHELAHIKRNDYLVNIFQSIVEVLFFYHPAIWWISKNIRNERENACDDIAILANINRKALAEALTNLEVLNHKKTMLALAFLGNKTSLLKRVKRILNPQKTKITMTEGFISICILLASLSIMSFSSNMIKSSKENKPFAKTIKKSQVQIPHLRKATEYFTKSDALKDTIVRKNNEEHSINYSLNGSSYKLVLGDNKSVKKFFANDKEIPKSKWTNYQKQIDYGIIALEKHEIEMKKHEEDMKRHEADMEKHDKEMKAHDEEMKKHEKEMLKHEREMREHEKVMIEHEKQMKIHEHKMQIVEGLIGEMKKDGLIDKNAISYKIIFNDTELVINGKKQSSKVHKKYKQMFHEKAKGKHKLDVELNKNPNYYEESKTVVTKMQIASAEKDKQKMIENLKKLEVKLKELNLKKDVIQKDSKINEVEKKKMLEKIMQYQAELKEKQQMTEIKMKQLVIEYEQIKKEAQKIKETKEK